MIPKYLGYLINESHICIHMYVHSIYVHKYHTCDKIFLNYNNLKSSILIMRPSLYIDNYLFNYLSDSMLRVNLTCIANFILYFYK